MSLHTALVKIEEAKISSEKAKKFISIKIVKPLKKRYCHGTERASSIKRTTKAPKDQNIPAIKTIKIAVSALPCLILFPF